MQVHRPDLYSQMQAAMRDAFEGVRRAEGEAGAIDPETGVTWVPATLDAHASTLIEGETWASI